MDKLVVLAYDLAAVLIILMTIAYSAQRGVATGVVRLIGQLAAFFGAAYLSRWGSEIIYNQFFKTEVTAFLNRNLQGGQLSDIVAQLQAGVEQLPRISANILGMAVDTDAISQALSGGVSEVTAALEQMVIGPAVRGFLSVALFTIIFAALGIFVRLLTSAVHFVFRSPILSPIDRFLGGVMGFLQASLNLYLICVVLKLVFYFIGSMKYCNQGIIMDTLILSKFYAFDPLTLFA